jgi:hypothetical protein
VVVGDDDFICDKISQADRIVKSIPSAHELAIKEAGHFVGSNNLMNFLQVSRTGSNCKV